MENKLKRAAFMAKLLDTEFKLGKFRFGLDPLIGLIPGVGDFVSLGLSLYIVGLGFELKLPWYRVMQMLWNVGLDALVGSIPILGDIFDFTYKANLRNLRILQKFTSASFE